MSHIAEIQFGVYKGIDKPLHRHPETELMFIISGSMEAGTDGRSLTLAEDDILLMNSGMGHWAKGEECLFCMVKFPWELLSNILGDEGRRFVCNSVEDTEHSYAQLRSLFRELILQYVHTQRRSDCLIDSLLLRLLDELVEHFQDETSQGEADQQSGEVRLQQIIQFVNQNYRHNLSLSKMAEDFHVSTSTLSRFFKKSMGCYFVDYVNQVRVQSAMKDLAETDENITKIVVSSGFSNLTAFNRVFRELNGMSPTEYRQTSRRDAPEKQKQLLQATEELRRHIQRRSRQSDPFQGKRQESIVVNSRAGERYEKKWLRVMNIGSAYQMTQSNLQSHLLLLKEQLGFRYVRIWNVFSKGLMISDGQRVGGYSFDNLDSVLDFLLEHHIKPYLDLGRRPYTITRNEKEMVFQEQECIDFRSQRVWEDLVRSFIRHLVKRYGREEVGTWIFELSCIPTDRPEDWLYPSGGKLFDYSGAFCYLYRVLREYVPQAMIGGTGAVLDYRPEAQRSILKECIAGGCTPDFYSIVLYPYENRGEYALARRTRRENWDLEQVDRARGMLEELGLEQCKLFVCEWNCSLSNRSFINDSCYRSAWLTHGVSRLCSKVDLLSVCMGSDWVDNYYDNFRIVNGNMGMVSQYNVRKPAFFAMQFLKSLGDFVIERREHCIITRTDHFSYYILCFNYKRLNDQYYCMEEDEPQPNQLDNLFEDHEPLELELVLEQMPEDEVFTVKRRSINEQEGSILPEWGRFHYDESLEQSDIRYLRDTCFPRMSMERVTTQDGALHVRERLNPNEVSLLHIYQSRNVRRR